MNRERKNMVSKWYKNTGLILDLSIIACVCYKDKEEDIIVTLKKGGVLTIQSSDREELTNEILKALLEYENGYNDSMLN
ncbi:MAG: hypothetical protein GY782_02480 [Gammaproteobacteria bacterium]|nr:hypothetical protein [Gammaproteobacteria bacterium]